MVEDHYVFQSPANKEQKIWRYLDFTKMADLLVSKSLFFCRADLFEDPFEGSLPKKTALSRNFAYGKLVEEGKLKPIYTADFLHRIGQEEKRNYAINCWHMGDHESAAMWNLYAKSGFGVALQSTYERLRNCLDEHERTFQLGMVKYVDYDIDEIDWGNGFYPYVHKRLSFEHEQELRAVIWNIAGPNRDQVDFNNGGFKVGVDLKSLIERIYVAPSAPNWFAKLVKDLILELGYNLPTEQSGLDAKPIW